MAEKSDSIVIPSLDKLDTNLIKCSVVTKQCCDYLNLCQRFKASLALPANFFAQPSELTCFCIGCCKVRGEELYKKRGDPPKEFAIPQGWVRFLMKASNKGSWHTAYHGSKLSCLRKILDHGQLLPLGKILELLNLVRDRKDLVP